MLSEDVETFVLANLPAAPARVLEVGAGSGDLARSLSAAGYSVVAVDPEASTPDVLPIPLRELDEPGASFDAAVAVVSLHHVDPLEESCARLARLLGPRAVLLVDELDIDHFDERGRPSGGSRSGERSGSTSTSSPAEVIARRRREVHALQRLRGVLDP